MSDQVLDTQILEAQFEMKLMDYESLHASLSETLERVREIRRLNALLTEACAGRGLVEIHDDGTRTPVDIHAETDELEALLGRFVELLGQLIDTSKPLKERARLTMTFTDKIDETQDAMMRLLATFSAYSCKHIDEASKRLSLIHISEPTRLRRISYAVFCLKKKN